MDAIDFFKETGEVFTVYVVDRQFSIGRGLEYFKSFKGKPKRAISESTIIISQFPIKSWFDLFREHTYADACLARITDKRHSYRLEMNGISMREAEK